MIGSLSGNIEEIASDYIIINVSQVGYLVYTTNNIILNAKQNDKLKLYIWTYIREDQIYLYGFSSLLQKEQFLLLKSVKGVGAKIALNIVSSLDTQMINNALMLQDTKIFNSISGIGKKTAERILVELKDKFQGNSIQSNKISSNNPNNVSNKSEVCDNNNILNIRNDAVDALVSLGISRIEASTKIDKILSNHQDNIPNISDIISLALKDR